LFGEIGPDFTKFRGASAFASWMGLCPDNDNPYSESQFRTLKYREFPDRFGCIQDSRAFCQQFF
jgi:hypothetical protein